MIKDIAPWKISATIGGAALTANAVWLNAVHISHAEGWGSPLVAASIVVTLCAAVTPAFAERAAKTGQPLKAVLLWAFFALAVAFSLSSSIARSSGYADGKVASAEKSAERDRLAREAYAAAKATQADECVKRGPKCRAAEDAVRDARSALQAAEPVTVGDPSTRRLSAVLGVSEEAVAMYSPLMLPLALELGGFILLALGLAPRRLSATIDIGTSVPSSGTADQKSAAADSANVVPSPAKPAAKSASGTKNYYQQRLQRDFPEIAKRVESGEISVYKASVEAGLRKAPAKSKWADAATYLERVTA